MEIELKYAIGDEGKADAIWENEEIKKLEEEGSRSCEELTAIYYDTEDLTLLRHDIAFRIREEGNRLIATLKWNGKTVGALHTREELNVNLGEGKITQKPDLKVFDQSEIGGELLELIGDRTLSGFIEVRVSRRKVRVDKNGSIFEIALDAGTVMTQNGSCEISEAEIELYTGKEEDLVAFGDYLAHKYHLEPETKSKFARGLALLNKI